MKFRVKAKQAVAGFLIKEKFAPHTLIRKTHKIRKLHKPPKIPQIPQIQ
ncbi:hypothetical protein [Helicobacter sp. 16-1353]|nr:hypothetical protein [Helicobacter sp. 16-1353]